MGDSAPAAASSSYVVQRSSSEVHAAGGRSLGVSDNSVDSREFSRSKGWANPTP